MHTPDPGHTDLPPHELQRVLLQAQDVVDRPAILDDLLVALGREVPLGGGREHEGEEAEEESALHGGRHFHTGA